MSDTSEKIEVVTAPANWISVLFFGEENSLREADTVALEQWVTHVLRNRIVMNADEPWFTWIYELHGGTCNGGFVCDYTLKG